MTDPAISARNKKNRRNGADWEAALKNGMREHGFNIEHLHLTGAEDEGDLVIREEDGTYLVLEAKTGAFQPGTFIKEAEAERLNFAKHRSLPDDRVDSVVIVKRRGANWRQAFVLTTVEDYFGLSDED